MTTFVVKSAVTRRTPDTQVGSDVYAALDELATDELEQAAVRAKYNSRKTVKGYDLCVEPDTDQTDLIVKSAVKRFLEDLYVGQSLYAALNTVLATRLNRAKTRAALNDRNTVQAHDI